MPKRTWREVLIYRPNVVSQATIRRYYDKWRREQGLPQRCDNPKCRYHNEPLVWNGKPLKLILDHSDGNRRDNSPQNLHYLCPNCNSQLLTQGGGNKGRVTDIADHKFTLVSRDGTLDHRIIPPTGVETVTGQQPTVAIGGDHGGGPDASGA